jgi:hypothetical protein
MQIAGHCHHHPLWLPTRIPILPPSQRQNGDNVLPLCFGTVTLWASR